MDSFTKEFLIKNGLYENYLKEQKKNEVAKPFTSNILDNFKHTINGTPNKVKQVKLKPDDKNEVVKKKAVSKKIIKDGPEKVSKTIERQIETEINKIPKLVNNNVNAIYKIRKTLTLHQVSTRQMKKNLGEFHTYRPNVFVEATEQNAPQIAETAMRQYKTVFKQLQTRFPQGFQEVLKLSFITPEKEGRHYINVSLRGDAIEYRTLLNKIIDKVCTKFHGGTSFKGAVFSEMSIYAFGLTQKGGCCGTKRGKLIETLKYQNMTVKLYSPQSSNDNCLIMCFTQSLGIKGSSLKPEKVRKDAGVELEGMISFTNVEKIADYFEVGYVLLNEKQEIISSKNIEDEKKVTIMLMNNHYYIVKDISYDYCQKCGQKFNTNKDHQCNKNIISYKNRMIDGNKDYVPMINCQDKQKMNDNDIVFFDLETFQDESKHCHEPYACGYSIGREEPTISYGKHCMEDFIDEILKLENKSICAYNGSGFDFYILLEKLADRDIDVEKIILNNGAILSFKFGKKGKENKVFDLYRFINSSLDDACESYDIKNRKQKFDVLKVQSWEDAEKYRDEVEPYLKYDVLSLSELFFTFSDYMYDREQINITKYMTLSHMAYNIWQGGLTELIELMDLEKYLFVKKGTYGARCYPLQQKFKSIHYDDVINGQMTHHELLSTNEYIFNADATSLYPASMHGTDFCDVQYPTGLSHWSDKPEKEFNDKKVGYYEINFDPPRDIRHPVLPRKDEMSLEWSLIQGTGVYTNIDIENAINSGYKIKFINKCLIWDTTSNLVFKEYIDRYFQMKCDADNEANPVKRSIAKLMLNAMYGKTLQKAIFESTTIVNNHQQLCALFRENNIIEVNPLNKNDSRLLVTYGVKEEHKHTRITKPSQLGGLTLAYSRRIMLHFMKAIDPTLKSQCFTYTDTDSLHMFAKDAKKLKKLGFITSKDDAKLGYLCNDIKKEGIIIKELNLAPKTYFYEYINDQDDIKDREDAVMKCKGIPQKCLKPCMYEDYDKQEQKCEFSGLKKINTKVSKKNEELGINHFSIINNTQIKTFMKSEWQGFDIRDNQYYPRGYQDDDDDCYYL